MIILVNGSIYKTNEQKLIENIVNIAKIANIAKEETKGTNSIYAIKYTKLIPKTGRVETVLEMRRDKFVTKESLMKQVASYQENGIIVYYQLSDETN